MPSSPFTRRLKKIITTATTVIKNGGVVIFPTETVYGLGADATNPLAVKKIYRIKKRPPINPLIVHISDIKMLEEYIAPQEKLPPSAFSLIKKFWPGPLTLVMKNCKKKISPVVTAGLKTIAVRSPSDPIARALIKSAGVPIAAPSANLSGKVSPTSYRHILEDYFSKHRRSELPDMIIPGGRCPRGLESTIVDITVNPPKILRPGAVPAEKIARILKVKVSDLTNGISSRRLHTATPPDAPLLSPGMMKKHYRPEARVYLFSSEKKLLEWFYHHKHNLVKKIFVMATPRLKSRIIKTLSHPIEEKISGFGIFKDEKSLARNLYSYFRKADRLGADIILVSHLRPKGLGIAINDRLLRASSRKIF